MAKCSRCGTEMGSAKYCPSCGYGPSESVLTKGVDRVAKATGTVLEKGVRAGETVVREARPVVKTVAAEGKKGIVAAKDKTLEVAKKLKKET